MKKFAAIIITLLSAISCTNLDEILDQLRDHEERIQKLETICTQLNSNVEAIQTILTALEQNDYITDITKITEAGIEIGYSITFAKGGTVNIYHGSNGTDAPSPKIGIRKASDGEYYWTSNDEWLTDESGEKIPASVPNDPDGKYITPSFRIAEGVWYISYDGGDSWVEINTLEEGSHNVECLIKQVDTTSDNEYIIFVLNNGEFIKIPRGGLNLILSVSDNKLKSGEQIEVPYSITGAKEDDKITVRILTTYNCSAAVNQDERILKVIPGTGKSYVDIYVTNQTTGEMRMKTLDFFAVEPIVELSLYTEKDFFLMKRTTTTGTDVYIPITSNTKNARIFTYELENGATYRYSYCNSGEAESYRTLICSYGSTIKDLSIAPLGYESENYKITSGTYSEALKVIREQPKRYEGTYTGTFTNSENAKTLIMFVGWGVSSENITASIEKIQGGELPSPPEDNEEVSKPESYSPEDIMALTNILRANINTHNIATSKILEIAYNFWKRRNEFIYCSNTALDRPWDYWSYIGYTDSPNTGLTVTEHNGGYKRIDCSTFARYVMNGIDYYSTPYYNTLEWTEIEQGALTDGKECSSTDLTLCRSGKMYLRHGKKHIIESADASKYYFTRIYAYDQNNNILKDLTGVSSFTLPEGTSYIRAEMKVQSSSNYKAAIKGTSPAAILKCLRIREDERLEINAGVPSNGHRNTFQICPWFEENGYGLEAYKDYNPLCWEDSDFKPGTIIFMGRSRSSAYKHITHMAVYIGSGYIIHSTAPLGLLGGEGIFIERLKDMEYRYDVPFCAAASPEYHKN